MRRIIVVIMLSALMAMAAAGVAWAQTPITVSEHYHKVTETFTGTVNCQGTKLYHSTVTFTRHGRDHLAFNARSFEEFVGTYTDDHKVTAKASDGSKINYYLHSRFSVNAKGEVTVDFVRVRPDASCISPGE